MTGQKKSLWGNVCSRFGGWWLRWELFGLLSNNANWERDTQRGPGYTSVRAWARRTHLSEENVPHMLDRNIKSKHICVFRERESVPVQRRMCVAKSCSCCLKKDMLVWVTSTPSRTETEDSLWGEAMEKPHLTNATIRLTHTLYNNNNNL